MNKNKQPRTAVTTFSKSVLDLFNPSFDGILVVDIAHHQAKMDRYNGAAPFLFSVAHHSMLVASILPNHLKLWGLLHDAPEAYLGDAVSPLKHHLQGFTEFKTVIVREIAELSQEMTRVTPEMAQFIKMLLQRIENLKDTFLGYRELEAKIMDCVARKFGLPEYDPVIKTADKIVTAVEMSRVLGWEDLVDRDIAGRYPDEIAKIYPFVYERTWQDVRADFLEKFEEYSRLLPKEPCPTQEAA